MYLPPINYLDDPDYQKPLMSREEHIDWVESDHIFGGVFDPLDYLPRIAELIRDHVDELSHRGLIDREQYPLRGMNFAQAPTHCSYPIVRCTFEVNGVDIDHTFNIQTGELTMNK